MSNFYDPFGEFEDLNGASFGYLREQFLRESQILIMNEVYRQIIECEKENKKMFKTKKDKIKSIQKMIDWFEDREEYEKCLKLKKILEQENANSRSQKQH